MFARVILTFCVVILSVVSIHFSNNAAPIATDLFGYCASSPDQSAVYFSQVFDIGPTISVTRDTTPVQNEYNEYLKGRFDFKSNAAYAAGCPLFENMSMAQSAKRDQEIQMRQGHQIVEVEWNYIPAPGQTTISVPSHAMPRTITAQPDHTFCVSDTYQGTVYFTGPVASPPPVAMYQWSNGFTQFLKSKYSFEGRVYCNMGTAESGRRLVNAHLDGSRAAGRRVVQTDWKYDASQATNASQPADRDEDRTPVQRPAAQPPNLQARDFALKENPRVTAHCVADRLMAEAFDCDCLRRQIYAYRLAHVSDTLSASPTPFEELFKGDKLDFKSCVQVEWKFKLAVRGAVRSQGASEASADCAIQKFRALLIAKPYPTQSKQILNEAINECR
jgi:hypothetical protein